MSKWIYDYKIYKRIAINKLIFLERNSIYISMCQISDVIIMKVT